MNAPRVPIKGVVTMALKSIFLPFALAVFPSYHYIENDSVSFLVFLCNSGCSHVVIFQSHYFFKMLDIAHMSN